MSRPATDARLAAAARGFSQVISRGNSHIVTKNPQTGKYSFDAQVGVSGNDGFAIINSSSFNSSGAGLNLDRNDPNYWHVFALFTSVTIPDDATIDSALMSLKLWNYSGSPVVRIYAEKAANPSAPTSVSDLAGRTRTTAYVDWAVGYNDNNFHDSGNIAPILEELMGSYSYASGAAILLILENTHSSGSNFAVARSYDYTGNVSGPKLHIEYTAAATGNPYYAYAQQ